MPILSQFPKPARPANFQAMADDPTRLDEWGLIAKVSHDLRTPMNGVLGMTRLALGTNLNEEQREYLEVIWSSAESLLTLINDLLDHAKIESGNLVIESIPFNLREVREKAESRAILRALARTDGNVSKTSELLGVTRPTLYNLMKKYGIGD